LVNVIENINRVGEKQDADHAHYGAHGPQKHSRQFHASVPLLSRRKQLWPGTRSGARDEQAAQQTKISAVFPTLIAENSARPLTFEGVLSILSTDSAHSGAHVQRLADAKAA
jgi:hypothetical protein